MVYDDSFSCTLREETLHVRGATRYAFIARPCPGPGGPMDEAGACQRLHRFGCGPLSPSTRIDPFGSFPGSTSPQMGDNRLDFRYHDGPPRGYCGLWTLQRGTSRTASEMYASLTWFLGKKQVCTLLE